MKVAVTGGAGFIGSWVVDRLAAAGHQTVVFDPRGRCGPSTAATERMLGDVRDPVAVSELCARVDAVIHLAAVLGTQETVFDPRPVAAVNVDGGLNVLDACRHRNLPLVNICVGNWWMNNPYSITKHAFERMVAMAATEYGLPAVNVRCVNAYGPRQAAAAPFAAGKVRKILPAFTCRALSGMAVEVYGDGQQVSDCVYVADVAGVLVRALEQAAAGWSGAVEVGPVEHATVNDVAELVVKAAERHTGILAPIRHVPMRPGEQPGATVTADTSTLTAVGVDPAGFMPLAEGVTETVDWFEAERGVTWTPPN